ncbi:sensor domain-containing protein, partial [Streptomyces silvensis]|uniref:sensor domain-containing protein n=1 Tax=Streptomyces silvensis TaxID=1765722 RepID=UPI000ACD13A7
MATDYGQGYPLGSGERGRAGFRRLPAALRAPLEGRTWREFLYVLLSLPLSIIGFVFAVTMLSVGAGLLITFVGVPVLALGLASLRGFGALERIRARALLGVEVGDPHPMQARGGFMAWMGAVLKSGVSWRHVVYAVLHMPWAIFSFTVSVVFWTYGWAMLTYPLWFWVFPMHAGQDGIQIYGDDHHRVYLDNPFEIGLTSATGLLVTLATPWIIRALTTVDRVMVFGLLGPSRLVSRVVELESDRGVVVDTAA